MSTSIAIQSGRPSSKITISTEAEQDVRQAYLVSMRQRFKAEINRLTRGDMLVMLQRQLSDQASAEDAKNLSFLISYVYAWNWLQQNLHSDYRAEVLSTFAKGPQAFLMEMLLRSNSTAEFIQSYILHWQKHQGQAPLQQQQLLQLLERNSGAFALAEYIETVWDSLHLFDKTFAIAYKDLAKQEKNRYTDMLGAEDKERLTLVDKLPDTESLKPFSKLGIIPPWDVRKPAGIACLFFAP